LGVSRLSLGLMRLSGILRSGYRSLLTLALAGKLFAAVDQVVSPPLDLKYEILDLANTILNVASATSELDKSSRAVKGEVLGMEVKESDLELKINLSGDILFDFDKASLRPAAEPTLTEVAARIQKYPRAKVLIEGHTDSKGNQPYNLKLSERRAASVKTWLAAKGIAEANVTTRGWGAAKPVAPNSKQDGADDPDGRQKNRRVEITIKK
jgi:outer membrane protein OmpA-like peptidoglycan-associated protein